MKVSATGGGQTVCTLTHAVRGDAYIRTWVRCHVNDPGHYSSPSFPPVDSDGNRSRYGCPPWEAVVGCLSLSLKQILGDGCMSEDVSRYPLIWEKGGVKLEAGVTPQRSRVTRIRSATCPQGGWSTQVPPYAIRNSHFTFSLDPCSGSGKGKASGGYIVSGMRELRFAKTCRVLHQKIYKTHCPHLSSRRSQP